MKLIKDLDLKPFLRTVWVNQKARDHWERPIQEISSLVQRLEILSVLEDQRACATTTISARELINFTSQYPDLIFKPIRLAKKFSGFAHKHEDPTSEDKDFYIHLVISKQLYHANQFYEAYQKGNHDIQGELLGFPKCCRDFFTNVWAKGYIDPIWQMKGRTNIHPHSNPLLRYLGVRLSFHIPCSFHCEETIKVAQERLKLIENDKSIMLTEALLHMPIKWDFLNVLTQIRTPLSLIRLMEALLSMPMEWDCWHGIAQIKTPLFWIITSSTPTEERYQVKIKGNFKPREV